MKDKLKSISLMDAFITTSIIVLFAIVIDQVGTEVIQTIQNLIK